MTFYQRYNVSRDPPGSRPFLYVSKTCFDSGGHHARTLRNVRSKSARLG